MFPNHVEFFVREKEAEHQADIEQIRRSRLVEQRSGAGRRRLAQVIYWVGSQLLAWSEKLQVQPVAPTSEQPLS